MLKQANENKGTKMTLTAKLTNMIIKKSYLKQYFTILQENLKLNIELNNGNSKEGLNIEDEEYLHDLDDDENLFANNGENVAAAASGLSADHDDYEVRASNNFANSLNGSSARTEYEDEDSLDVQDSLDERQFLN